MKKIGLIAGNRRFPFYFAEEAAKKGYEVVSVFIKEETEKELEKKVSRFIWVSPGELGKLIRYFKDEGITEAVLAGQVKHRRLYQIRPDLRAVKLLLSLKNKKADSLLGALTIELEKEGIRILPSTLFLENLLAEEKSYTGKLSREEEADVEFGFETALELGRLDVGQTVAVKGGAVVAVEAMEGTDSCIRRAGEITKDFCIVKTAKPKQDLRFDVPVIGRSTLAVIKESGGKTLALEAGKVLFFDREESIAFARKNRINIVGVKKNGKT